MGIRQVCLVILVFVLLSSSVHAIGFQWALGYPEKKLEDDPPGTWTCLGRNYLNIQKDGSYTIWGDTCGYGNRGSGIIHDLPFILIKTLGRYNTRYRCGGTRSEGCQQRLLMLFSFNDHRWYEEDYVADVSLEADFYGIADQVNMFNSYSNTACHTRSQSQRCQDRLSWEFLYAPIVSTGFANVFPHEEIKYIGPVNDLIPKALQPDGDNETIYLGVFTKQFEDVLFWFGPAGSEPTDPLKRETIDYYDFINFCADYNHDKICDYLNGGRVQCVEDAGGDWYQTAEYPDGICCGPDVEDMLSYGLIGNAINCSYDADAKAQCGETLGGKWQFAPLKEVGAVYELLGCPGYSTVSDSGVPINCKSSGKTTGFQQVFKSACPAGTYSALSDYWDGTYYVFYRHPQSMLGQDNAPFRPSYHFDICTRSPGAKAKAALALVGENIQPDSCDEGYVDIGPFSYSTSNLLVKGRVCIPSGSVPEGSSTEARYTVVDGKQQECPGDYYSVKNMPQLFWAHAFNVCTNIPDVIMKLSSSWDEDSPDFEPAQCDAGYSEIAVFDKEVPKKIEDSTVKEWSPKRMRLCAPSANVPAAKDSNFFSIDGVLGTHGYLCSNGELFECAGDLAPYSFNSEFIADTGLSTNDLVGSGGCPPKILAYWTFDGSSAVDYVSGFNGNVVGGSSVSGKINGGIHLEVGDSIELPGSVPVSGSEFTVEAWINPADTTGLRKIVEKEDSFRMAVDDSLLVGAVHTNQPMGDFGSRRVVANVWHHVALSYDGSQAMLYLDGVSVTDSGLSGGIVWNNNSIVIGGNFLGDVDDVALYDKALRGALIKRHAKSSVGYCQAAASGLSANYYCAADGEWTTDLDIKDESSCNKAGFVWTGNFCCSEDDDFNEYYNDHDTPPADLAKVSDGGQTVDWHALADISSSQIILSNRNQFVTIKGPAKLLVETYSAESPTDIGACPVLGKPEPVIIAPWEKKTIRIIGLGASGEPCRYRHKIITAEPFLALGGCWDKDFVPIGHFSEPNIINYHGHFYSCGISQDAPELEIQDTQNGGKLVSVASTSCSDIKLNARGAGLHVVCNPGGKWQFTNDSAATTSSEVSWDITGANASQYGCCAEDQCWTGFECVNIGEYYTDPTSGDSYYCEE